MSEESGIYKLKDSILTIIEPVFLKSPYENSGAVSSVMRKWSTNFCAQMMVVPRKLSPFVLYRMRGLFYFSDDNCQNYVIREYSDEKKTYCCKNRE